MNEQPPQVQVTLTIRKCICNSFVLTDFGKENQTIISVNDYKFSLNVNVTIDENSKIVSISATSVLQTNSEKNQDIAKIETLNEFYILNLDQIIIKSDVGVAVPEQVIIPILSIVISNLRGMYTVKLEDTIYKDFVLPLMDASQLLQRKQTYVG